jgi:hypothetical protein
LLRECAARNTKGGSWKAAALGELKMTEAYGLAVVLVTLAVPRRSCFSGPPPKPDTAAMVGLPDILYQRD